ncbi:hypothetical protein [Massilia sp. DD77]|uniref:hypothetical protein n=1 Tax=Massilia sp. DD77 TaxID=3109349 RepID=UPI002FFEFF32
MHAAVAAAGHVLRQVNGVWVSNADDAVQAIIDGYTLEQARAPMILAIKALARDMILAFLPDWKQSNCNARMNELNMIRMAREWTTAEQDEVVALQALWHRAANIRLTSDAQEAALGTLTTFEDVLAFDIATGWPEAS